MIARAVAAGVPFAWFTADETYGAGQVAAGLAGREGHLVRDSYPVQRHGNHARG
jgi:hypothetical protein